MGTNKEQLSNDLAVFVEQGQWAKAVRAQQGLLDLEPTNSNYCLRLGDYQIKAGDKASALRAYYQAAELFVKAGFSVKGIATYKMILRVAPDDTQATELMRAINASPAVAGAAGVPVPEPAPAPLLPASPIECALPLQIEPPKPDPVITIEEVEETKELELEIEIATAQGKKDINPLFAAFSAEEFGAIVDKLESLEFQTGERIISEGAKGDALYLISSGGGVVVKEVDGRVLTLGTLSEGEFFGEMSLLSGSPRSASVFATTNTEVLRLKSADLFEIMKNHQRIETVLEEFYEKRSKAIMQKMKEMRR